ncbi:cytochrome c [Variovorax sp. YR752]|uniref:c-type cytochrome n=1 Tax=Variovorax sp. YR752 TaxID=1884383 RepID=UPI0031378273
MKRALAALLLAAAALVQPQAKAADAERGRSLYDACAPCHRPSGMGNFEGGLAVPPITGPTLFRPFDRDTGRFFPAASRWRIRPAYDEAALGRLLREGRTPDGVILPTTMPRFDWPDTALADLGAYLRTLSSAPPAGLSADTLRIATVSTPDADAARRDAMLATLRRFVERKNGQSRQEAQRSAQATRTREMATYRKFRVWRHEHWALHGEPSTWAAQLDAHQARAPVYALVAGIGAAQWAPVDDFCARHRLPCLLPLVEAGGGPTPGFYSLHYHAGIDADARLAARALRQAGVQRVQLWGHAPSLAGRVRSALEREGLATVADGTDDAKGANDVQAVVSLLAPPAHAARLRDAPLALPVAWLPGTHALGRAELDAVLPLTARGWIVTPMRTGEALDRQLQRATLWLRGNGLSALPADVAASTLQAATVLGEGLAHVDFGFSPEYLLELLEHGLENLVPWSPYPRLAIGPDQRIASKGSWLAELHDGRAEWRWMPQP